jgi:predicted NBD/HSP70 family sugar kinase
LTGSSSYSVEKVPDGRSGGTTQAETRVYNERLIVSLVRRHGELSKSDLTRLTGLAPQTITTLVNRAADEGLLRRRDPLRGRRGQPQIPYSLHPEAAYSLGLKVDFRGADIALVNFVGEVLAFERTALSDPAPDDVMSFARVAIARLRRRHRSAADRIAGMGIASPFALWPRSPDDTVPSPARAAWMEVDIRAELDRLFDWPVYLFNDGMVSAGAELMFGTGLSRPDFLYVYFGQSVSGGLVLDHHLVPGRNNLAGALGMIPVPRGNANGGAAPFVAFGSLEALSGRLNEEAAGRVWSSPADWGELGGPLEEWIEEAAEGLAHAAQSAVALIDLDNLVIDGAVPATVRRQLARSTRRKLARALVDRPEPFTVLEGSFGDRAPSIGGASIPLLVKYSNDKALLFKE